MMLAEVELEVVYNGAMERQTILAQQRAAPSAGPEKQSRREHHAAVGRFLERYPQAWTMTELAKLLRLSVHAVNHALYALVQAGQVTREFPGVRGRRGHPQRYRWIAS